MSNENLINHVEQEQYGSSVSVCDYVLEHQLEETRPLNVVDFGAGHGKNGRIVRRTLPGSVRLIAVEGCEKTAHLLSTGCLYDDVYTTLIQEFLSKDANKYDLAIFGDVLEHLKPKEIRAVIGQCREKFKDILIICPLHDIFQDESYGNPLEVHQTYVTSNFFDRYKPIEKHIVITKDYTVMNVRIAPEYGSKKPAYKKLSWFMFHRAMLILQPLGLARPFVDILKRHALRYKWLLRG